MSIMKLDYPALLENIGKWNKNAKADYSTI